MKWKIVNNSQQDFNNTEYTGVCNKHNKKATVTVNVVIKKICKTDLQNTNVKLGCKCSLLPYGWAPCIDTCPLITDKY